ncbi:tetratricopeptide repeat protein [Streptomyces sp. AC512_CC834]|uniref:tetratricopeptide repeat protein n=1 Tax=Streptomyces sp. AC512_CC834 TaxID=2823691 RepID=UPI001C26BE98|nr:tetratricopeptide repeat protein [Streptomyces sp. AC512_CC834]
MFARSNDNRSRHEPPAPAGTPPSAAGRRRWPHVVGCAVLLAVAVSAGAVAVDGAREGGGIPVADAPQGRPGMTGMPGGARPDAGIPALQARLKAQPRDFGGWATLGLAYVEQARTDGDPSRYPRAERALERSLDLKPGNDQALAGRAALAAARHDFAHALTYADRALDVNPYNERALCSRVDALVELGRYDDAARAADTADSRRPGVPVFTRFAYVRELRGEVDTARRVLEQALAGASSPGDVAYVATQLGRLAWNQGDYPAALRHYARALAADDAYLPALEGRGRARAASGDRSGAVRDLEEVVARAPLPGPLVALGELYEAGGEEAKAREQYALVDAWTALARADGVNVDLDTARAAADHGDKEAALRAARAEWNRRRTVHTADALAWALHVNGRDEEALPYARRATATGYRDAVFLHHLGMIERAVGRGPDARRHLSAALDLNPGFSPVGAREARTALKELEASR